MFGEGVSNMHLKELDCLILSVKLNKNQLFLGDEDVV